MAKVRQALRDTDHLRVDAMSKRALAGDRPPGVEADKLYREADILESKARTMEGLLSALFGEQLASVRVWP